MIAFRSELVEDFDLNIKVWGINTEMLKRAKDMVMTITEVPVRYHLRVGKSKLNPLHAAVVDLAVALRMMRDSEPLLFFGGTGAGVVVLGLATGLEIVLDWPRTG